MGIFKLFSILSVLAAIIIAAYLYVSHLNERTSTPVPANSSETQNREQATPSTPMDSANDAVDNFNDQSQQRRQQVESELYQ